MTIDIEIDENEVFISTRSISNNIEDMENKIAEYMNDNIDLDYNFYLFLCDETWSNNSKLVLYKGLWKQDYNRDAFGKSSFNADYEFYSSDKKKVMFATFFELSRDDLFSAIKVNADQFSKHSFIFLSKKTPIFSVQDVFDTLGIKDDKYLGNNWDELVKFSCEHAIIPIQKWQGADELSLRLFLFDQDISLIIN